MRTIFIDTFNFAPSSCPLIALLLPLHPLRLLLPALRNPLQYVLTVLVELQLCNNDLAGMDADRDALAIGFLA